jgi:tetratricopeptide (TPR) repeat protein
LCDLGRHVDAERIATRVVEAAPDNWRGWCVLTRAYLGQGKYEQGRAAALEATQLRPDLEWPLRLLSKCENGLGRITEAVAAAETAVRVQPFMFGAHAQLGEVLVALGGRQPEAEAAAARALELGAHDAQPHVVAGLVARAGGHPKKAADAFRRALAINPAHPTAQNELSGLALYRITPRSLAEAANLFAQAASVNPTTRVLDSNVNYCMGVFVLYITLLVLLDAFAASYSQATGPIPFFALTAGVVFFAADFLHRASAGVRQRLWFFVRRRRAARTKAAEQVAAGLLLLAAALKPSLSAPLGTAAGVLAAGAAVMGLGNRKRSRRFPPNRTTRLEAIRRQLRFTVAFALLAALALVLAYYQRPHITGAIWTGLFLLIAADHAAAGHHSRKQLH